MRTCIVVLCTVVVMVAGCDPEISVCELPEELNVCEGPEDCLLVYCGVECCACPRAASQEQFDETYCMVTFEEGFDAARRQCQEARDTICEGVSCTGVNACPHPTTAVCEDGMCTAR